MNWPAWIFAALAAGMFVLYVYQCADTHRAQDERDAALDELSVLREQAAKVVRFPLSRGK